MAQLILSGIDDTSGQQRKSSTGDTFVDSGGNLILAGGVELLSETTGIDGTATGTTELLTVPASTQIVVTEVVVRVTAVSGLTDVPTLGIGIAAGEDDIVFPQSLTGLSSVGDVFSLDVSAKSVLADASDVINVGIDTGATATTLTLAIDLIGYVVGASSLASTSNRWVSFTPTGSFTTNVTYTGMRRQVGDTLEIQYKITFSGTPSPAGDLVFDMPSGFSADTSKILADSSGYAPTGNAVMLESGQVRGYGWGVWRTSLDGFLVTFNDVDTGLGTGTPSGQLPNGLQVNEDLPSAWGSGDSIVIWVKIPVM